MTEVDKTRLKELALSATGKNWTAVEGSVYAEDDYPVVFKLGGARDHDAEYIAALDPETVLALLEENTRLHRENEELRRKNRDLFLYGGR